MIPFGLVVEKPCRHGVGNDMDVPVASLLEYLLGQLGSRDSDRVSHPDVLHEPPTALLVPEEVVSPLVGRVQRSEVHTSALQSLMRISSAVFCLKKHKVSDKHNKP